MKEENKNVKNFPNSRNVPKLRFSEFNDEWEERYISEVISSKCKKYNPENSDSNYPSIELESLSQDSGELLSTFDSKNQKSIKNVFNTGDVLFGKLRPYLKKYYLADFDGVCSSEIWVLKSSIFDFNYLYAFVQSNSFISLTKISSGSKMPRADWNLVSSSSIVYPSNPDERKKIGELIQLINSRIQTQKKIIEKLETLMKVSRVSIFSQKFKFKDEFGNDFPKWKTITLGEVGNIITGKTPSTKDENLWNGEIQFVTPTDIKDNKYQYFTERSLKSSDKLNILPEKSIMFTCIASIGKMSLSSKPCVTNQQINSVIPNSNYDNEFIFYALANISDYIKSTQSSSTMPIINKTEFSKFKIFGPTLKEQTKIANFLSLIHEKIEIEKQILEKLELQKKFLFANLFV